MTEDESAGFEQNLEELEEIVRKMESGDLTLDESLEMFERGIALTRKCALKLENARQRIEKLVNENEVEEMDID